MMKGMPLGQLVVAAGLVKYTMISLSLDEPAALEIFGDQDRALGRAALGVVGDEEELHAVRAENVVLADAPDAGGHPAVCIAIAPRLRPIRIVVHGDPLARRR